jgi:hypothetical protein
LYNESVPVESFSRPVNWKGFVLAVPDTVVLPKGS